MTPTSFLLRTFLGFALLPLSANAQEEFLDLEAGAGSTFSIDAQALSMGEQHLSSTALPALDLAHRSEILASYDNAVRALEELERNDSPTTDAETGTELQQKDLTSTSLGTAGGFFSATLGVKGMQEKSEWKPLDTQGAGSLEFAWRIPRKAFAGVMGLAGSYNRQNIPNSPTGEVDTWALELYFGGKAYLEIPKSAIWGYAGAGVSLIYTEVEAGSSSAPGLTQSSSDWGIGAYAQLGILLRLNRAQSIGLEYRGLFGTNTSFFNSDVSVDYNQLSFVFLVAF